MLRQSVIKSPTVPVPSCFRLLKRDRSQKRMRPPYVAASIAHGFAGRSFKLRRDTRERRTQFCAEAVHSRNDGDGNAGGNQAVFNGRGSRLILYKPNKKLRHSGALGLPSSPRPQPTSSPLSVRKSTYCKLGKANSSNFAKKREFGHPDAATRSVAITGSPQTSFLLRDRQVPDRSDWAKYFGSGGGRGAGGSKLRRLRFQMVQKPAARGQRGGLKV
jgi:hypothetical protein